MLISDRADARLSLRCAGRGVRRCNRPGHPLRPRGANADEARPAALVLPGRRSSAAMYSGGALLAAALIGISVGAMFLWRGRSDTSVRFHSVAVLPFIADVPANNFLADGLTEATLNSLVQARGLRIAPRASAFHYKGLPVKPKDAGRELGVTGVVTGSVSQQENRMQIQVDLVDVTHELPDLGRALPRGCIRAHPFADLKSCKTWRES